MYVRTIVFLLPQNRNTLNNCGPRNQAHKNSEKEQRAARVLLPAGTILLPVVPLVQSIFFSIAIIASLLVPSYSNSQDIIHSSRIQTNIVLVINPILNYPISVLHLAIW